MLSDSPKTIEEFTPDRRFAPPRVLTETFLPGISAGERAGQDRLAGRRPAGAQPITRNEFQKWELGRPFADVRARLGNRPTDMTFGGKALEVTEQPDVAESLWLYRLMVTMVGGSPGSGGGSGAMEYPACCMHRAEHVIKHKMPAYRRCFRPRAFAVPLLAREEPLNPHLSANYFTYPIESVCLRKLGLFLISEVPCLFIYVPRLSGTGTGHELVGFIDELKVGTSCAGGAFECFSPNWVVVGSPTECNALMSYLRSMEEGTQERIERKRREHDNIEKNNIIKLNGDPMAAAVTMFDRFCDATARAYGCRLDDVFKAQNRIGVIDVVTTYLETTKQRRVAVPV